MMILTGIWYVLDDLYTLSFKKNEFLNIFILKNKMFLKNSWISTNEFIQLYCFYEENIMFLKTAQQSNAVSLISVLFPT